MVDLQEDVLVFASYLVLFIICNLLGKLVRERFTRFDIVKELVTNDNIAFSVSYGGYLLGVNIIFFGAYLGPHVSLLTDLLIVLGYTALGILMLNISAILNDKFILHTFSNQKLIIENRNISVGFVQMGSYIASSLIIAGSLYGEDGNLFLTIILFLLGQVGLIVFGVFFEKLTPFNLKQEIEDGNVSAGIALAGHFIALGIIYLKGSIIKGLSINEMLISHSFYLILPFIVVPFVRFVLDKLVIPESNINHEIAVDKNAGAAYLELVISVSFALLIFFLI